MTCTDDDTVEYVFLDMFCSELRGKKHWLSRLWLQGAGSSVCAGLSVGFGQRSSAVHCWAAPKKGLANFV